MVQLHRLLVPIGLALTFCACAPRKAIDEESSTASVATGLPIVGTWAPESYAGYYYGPMNDRQKVTLGESQLRADDWQVESNIDASGNGFIKTKVDCKPHASSAAEQPSGIPSPRSLGLFPDALKLRVCDKGQPVEFHQNHTVLSVPRSSVPRNLGLDGKDDSFMESCGKLRGLRFIKHHTPFNAKLGSTGCIGFGDSAASKLSLIVVPLGEIHAVRIDFKRIR